MSSRDTRRRKPNDASMSAPETLGQTAEHITAPWLQAAPLKAVFAALSHEGGEARVVGGAVRNTLLGLPVTDIDIATTVLPDDVMRLCRARGLIPHPTGIAHGTVTVMSGGQPFEITTLRRDVETDGRRAVVAFTDDWAKDAGRRDFTINALYAAPDGKLFDDTGGRADLTARRVRFIGDAHDRIREDYLRILRFFRFSAQYGLGPPDAAGLAACRDLRDGITSLSAERIGMEILKLVVATRASEIVPEMAKTGILEHVTGDPTGTDCFVRLTAIERTVEVAPDAIGRLAALLPEGAAANELARRLRLSNREAYALTAAMVPHPAYSPGVPLITAKAWLYRSGAENFGRGARLAWARSKAPTNDHLHKEHATLPERWAAPLMPVSGADVMALGIPSGPAVGKILESFETWWIAHDFTNDLAAQQACLGALTRKS